MRHLAAQVGDVGLHDRGVAVPVVLPDVIEDLGLGHDAPSIEHEVAQELELGGGQIHLDLGAVHLVGVLVQDQVGHAHDAVVLVLNGVGAAQDGADAGDDLLQPEGLGDVVVAADGQALDLVRHVIAGGQEEDRGGHVTLAQAPGHGEAVHVGQHDIEDHQVGGCLLHRLQRAVAVACDRDLEACEAQGRGQQVADVGFIVDDKEVSFGAGLLGTLHESHHSFSFWSFPERLPNGRC